MGNPATTIEEVIVEMTGIGEQAVLQHGDADGVACFNRLYLAVTNDVGASANLPGFFAEPAAMSRLDVIFAQLYFDAVADDGSGGSAPQAWRALFSARARPDIASIQFALAGMNAHINHDLPIALVNLWQETGGRPSRDSNAFADYTKVNDILKAEEESIKLQFETGVVKELDKLAGPIDDAIAVWSIGAAREHAWETAEGLWEVREVPFARDVLLDALDRIVAFAGHALLQPIA